MLHRILLPLSFAASLAAQAVTPAFNATFQAVELPGIQGIGSYGGTAFVPGNPNLLLVSPYPSTTLFVVPLVRDALGNITGTTQAIPVASVGGTDGGAAFGPNNVLFTTWYGPNRMTQHVFGSTSPNRVDDLTPLGVNSTVGSCTFVPAGLPGAGRLKVGTYSGSVVYDLPYTPDGNGTFALGNVTSSVSIGGGIEGLVYAPANTPLLGGQLLVCEWGAGLIVAYQCNAIGDPIANTRQIVIGGASAPGGGAVDPLTGDIVFLQSGGQPLILRVGAACGTFTAYGTASPGVATPTITGSGCSRLGQTITLQLGGSSNGIGLLALGYSQANITWNGLTVLQSLNVTLPLLLDATGQASVPLLIPTTPTLGYSRLWWQFAQLDASTQSGFAASAGLEQLVR
jgi:hypothetical protein